MQRLRQMNFQGSRRKLNCNGRANTRSLRCVSGFTGEVWVQREAAVIVRLAVQVTQVAYSVPPLCL